jgi:hypothetical protein
MLFFFSTEEYNKIRARHYLSTFLRCLVLNTSGDAVIPILHKQPYPPNVLKRGNIMERETFRRNVKHSPLCTWDGKSRILTMHVGRCRACDDIKEIRTIGKSKGIYGIDRKEMNKFCLSFIEWAICTKHTNPSCACGKPVLQRSL